MFGLLNIYKVPGPSSHDIVAMVRRRLGEGERVGHAGTLDPFAEGVLVICVGPATRLADYVQAQPKRYVTQVALGAVSTTDDPTGQITTAAPPAPPPAEQNLRQVLSRFVGRIQQVPPAHSAVHVDGRRAYKLARAGKDFQLQARDVTIDSIELLGYEYPLLELAVTCGSGTYIRSLARDIGAALGCGGYCNRLTRTAVGAFTIDQAVRPERLDPARDLLPPLLAVAHLPKLTANTADAHRLCQGQSVKFTPAQLHLDGAKPAEASELAVVDDQGGLVAICALAGDGATLRPVKVLGGS